MVAPELPPLEGLDLKYWKLYVLSAQDVHNLVATFFTSAALRKENVVSKRVTGMNVNMQFCDRVD